MNITTSDITSKNTNTPSHPGNESRNSSENASKAVKIIQTLNSEFGEKERKLLLGKIPYTTLKLLGYPKLAVLPHALQKYYRYVVNNNFIVNGKLKGVPLAEVHKLLKTNKGQREISRQLLAITTISEEIFMILYSLGVISKEVAIVATLVNRTMKFSRHSLACKHAKILFEKSLKNPESEKWAVWTYTSVKGLGKALNLAFKISSLALPDYFYGYRHLLSVGTGLMALGKRKHFGKQKAERKKLQKAAKEAGKGKKSKKADKKLKITKIDSNTSSKFLNISNEQIYLLLYFTALATLISQIYLKIYCGDEK